MNFEAYMDRMEEIVRELSSSDITLDQSLKLYEEGVKLAEQALALLEEGEGKVNILQQRMANLFSREENNE